MAAQFYAQYNDIISPHAYCNLPFANLFFPEDI